jgi:hypothetical protein
VTAPAPADMDNNVGNDMAHYACARCHPPSGGYTTGQPLRTRCGLTRPFGGVKRDVPECVVCRDLKYVYPCGESCGR